MPQKSDETTCPFRYLWQEPKERKQSSSTGNMSAPSCPAAATTGQCPLGFGTSGKPKMGLMHCIICKSVMYKASTTNCGHTYCKDCIEKFRDCPTCGADIVTVTDNVAVDQAIEEFLDAHAGVISFWDLEDDAISRIIERSKVAPDKPEYEKIQDTASFYIQAGMRAMSGGNIANALHRCTKARTILEGYTTDDTKKKMQCLSSLGTVHGAIGDCHKALGDGEKALEWYQKSIETLTVAVDLYDESDDEQSNDPFHALSVTMNKVGEMYHRQGDVTRAVEMYKQALRMRQDRFEACSHRNPMPVERAAMMMIDIATSQAKVADAMIACGHNADARRMNEEALALIKTIDIQQCRSASIHAKFARLKEYYEEHR